jgi:flavin-dependent dehydrogenase
MKQFDVAIIGGGIAGLVAAIELDQAGKFVVLMEKASQFWWSGNICQEKRV